MSIKTTTIDWLTGASLGLLVGLLVGLSASPVVATVVGALAALLGGVFGLAEKLPAGLSGASSRRLAAFALACVAALIGGILMRTHHVLSPSADQWRAQLVDIGITNPVEQTRMLSFLRFGLIPTGFQAAGKDGETAARAFSISQGSLYAEGTDFCAGLRNMVRIGAGPEDLLRHMSTGLESTQRTMSAIKSLPTLEQISALRVAPLYLCAP